ncbi:MAG TPA: aldo/keto reductase, partial [Armatimonadota bacterium]|nr:aldo/keto reductase [Armatimonadota bacterium]
MEKIRLGRTGLMVTRVGFGALPLQRVDRAEAARILCRAYDAGINFYDTARGYTDSEEKIGDALSGVRDRIVIATKSAAKSREGVLQDL